MDDDDFGGGGSRGMGMGVRLAMGMAEGMMLPVIMIGILVPVALYVIARWRDQRNPVPDGQLGLKFALSFFKWQGYQVALVGATMLLYSVLTKMPSEAREYIYRPAFGALLPGLLVFGVASYALSRTNHLVAPLAGRVLAGFNLMVTGAIGFFVLVMAFQTLFAKGDSGDTGRIVWSAVLVYVTAWIAQTVMFTNDVAAHAAEPGQVAPPAGMAPPPPAA